MRVTCDFFEDVRQDSIAALSRRGVRLRADADVHLAVVECFHLERRLIQPRPRPVLWSKQLRARCLNDEQRAVVETIAKELEQGVDLTPRMTKAIRRAGYNDGLLTDWGIHHLHVASPVDKGFVKRDDPLLFVFIAGGSAHLLDLLDHSSFEDDELIEIIHENWPDVVAPCRAPCVVPGSLSPTHSPEGRRMMRKKFVIGTQTKDGTVYLPPGGGVATSGHSAHAVQQANALLNRVRPAEVWVREHADLICELIEQLTGSRPAELHMQFRTGLILQLGAAAVFEKQTNAMLHPVPPPQGESPMVGIVEGVAIRQSA